MLRHRVNNAVGFPVFIFSLLCMTRLLSIADGTECITCIVVNELTVMVCQKVIL